MSAVQGVIVNLFDLSRAEMCIIREEFSNGNIKIFNDLMPTLMTFFPHSLPDAIMKAFSRYISTGTDEINWERFLSIMEDEVRLIEDKKYKSHAIKVVCLVPEGTVEYGAVASALNNSAFSISYLRKISRKDKPEKVYFTIVNRSVGVVVSKDMGEVMDLRYFARDYVNHFKSKNIDIVEVKGLDEEAKGLPSFKRGQKSLWMNHNDSIDSYENSIDTKNSKKGQNFRKHMDVMYYSGLEKRLKKPRDGSRRATTEQSYIEDSKSISKERANPECSTLLFNRVPKRDFSQLKSKPSPRGRGQKQKSNLLSVRAFGGNSKSARPQRPTTDARGREIKLDTMSSLKTKSRDNEKSSRGFRSTRITIMDKSTGQPFRKTGQTIINKTAHNSFWSSNPRRHSKESIDDPKAEEIEAELNHNFSQQGRIREGTDDSQEEIIMIEGSNVISGINYQNQTGETLPTIDRSERREQSISKSEVSQKIFNRLRAIIKKTGGIRSRPINKINEISLPSIKLPEGEDTGLFDRVEATPENIDQLMEEDLKLARILRFKRDVNGFKNTVDSMKNYFGMIEDAVNFQHSLDNIEVDLCTEKKVKFQSSPREKTFLKIFKRDLDNIKEHKKIIAHDLNYKKKPLVDAQTIEYTTAFYWDQLELIVISYINRSLVTFRIESRRNGEEIELVRGQEIVVNEVCSHFTVMRSYYDSTNFFAMAVFDDTSIRIYQVPPGVTTDDFLPMTLQDKNKVFELTISTLPKFFFYAHGFIVSSEGNKVAVYVQTGFSTFSQKLSVSLTQQFSATTISCLDYSSKTGVLIVGCCSGDIFFYEADLKSVQFKYKDINERILAIHVCDFLENVYIFYPSGAIKVFDLRSHKVIQEIPKLGKPGCIKWVQFPEVDHDLNELRTDNSDGTLKKAEKIITSKIRHQEYQIYLGDYTIWKLKLYIQPGKEFTQIAQKIKTLTAGASVFKKEIPVIEILNSGNKWLFCCQNPIDDLMLLVSDKKLVVQYDYNNKIIIRYASIDIESIQQVEYCSNYTQFMVVDSHTTCTLYSVSHIAKLRSVQCSLSHVLRSIPIFDGLYDVVHVALPDEVYAFRSPSTVKEHAYVDCRSDAVLAFRMESAVLGAYDDSDYIYLLTEDYLVTIISKKNMRKLKHFNLLEHFDEELVKYRGAYDRVGWKHMESSRFNDKTLIIVFEDNLVILCKFSSPTPTDIAVYLHWPECKGLHVPIANQGIMYFLPENKKVVQIFGFDYKTGSFITPIPNYLDLDKHLASLGKDPSRKRAKIDAFSLKDTKIFNPNQALLQFTEVFYIKNLRGLLLIEDRSRISVLRFFPFELAHADIYKMIRENNTLESKRANTQFLTMKRQLVRGPRNNANVKSLVDVKR